MHARPPVTLDTTGVDERRQVLAAIEAADTTDAAELLRVQQARELFIQRADEQARELRAVAEREEARLAKIRVEEMARERKEREQAAEAKRLRDLAAALKEIKEKYEGLTMALEVLCALQRTKMENRHQDLMDNLTTRWRVEMANIISFLDTKITQSETVLVASNEAIQTRHTEEQSSMQCRHEKEEDDYWFSLQRYLKGKTDRTEREKHLVDRFRAENVRELDGLLSKQRQEADDAQRRLAMESLGILQEADRRRAMLEKDVGKSHRTQTAKVWEADRNWMALVERERTNRLLARMLVEEDVVRARLAAQ